VRNWKTFKTDSAYLFPRSHLRQLTVCANRTGSSGRSSLVLLEFYTALLKSADNISSQLAASADSKSRKKLTAFAKSSCKKFCANLQSQKCRSIRSVKTQFSSSSRINSSYLQERSKENYFQLIKAFICQSI
jgi:hypothetical protein